MNGTEKIVERIGAEVCEQIAAMQAETAEKCRLIKEKYDKLAQEEYWRLVTAGAQDCEHQVELLSSAAAMESKKSILAMKQEAVSRVFDEAEKRLCDLGGERYTAFLAMLAAKAAETGLEEVIFNARDKAGCARLAVKLANELVKKRGALPKLTVSELTGDFGGGLIVRQGDIEVNCTLEKLVELSQDTLAYQVAEVLFSD